MSGEGAAGTPASRLAALLAEETKRLSDHRNRLGQSDEALAEVLLEIERGTLEQLQRVMAYSPTSSPRPHSSADSASQILRRRIGRLTNWAQRSKHPTQTETPDVVQGSVVPDEHEGDDPNQSS